MSNIDELKNKREYWRTRVFWLLVEVAFIFGIPAALGAFLGSWLKGKYGFGNEVFLFILSFTFIFSWVIVVVRYRQIKSKLDEVDREINRSKGTGDQ